ncbi:MAG: STAS domain-containing protein [Bacilli bacterium]|nr:STAS domain-containing protein [Bacilli bacterium]
MEIKPIRNDKELTIVLSGELNSATAPQFESFIGESLHDVESLIIDLEQVSYLSSAGLRVLLIAKKVLGKNGKMILKNAQPDVKDVFEITGFSNVLDIL